LSVLPTVQLHQVAFHAISEQQCISHIFGCLEACEGGWVVTANLDHLRRLSRHHDYTRLCRTATLIVADGMPLIWASRIQGTPLPERVAGSDLISSLSAAAARRGRSVYLLGGAPGTAEMAADVLQRRYPGLAVVGTYCPPFGFEHDLDEVKRIERRLCQARPDIIYVALGSPKQERLILDLRNRLPHAWWIGVGVSFSFLCDDVRRAPRWMQRIGLEWLHRLAQDPRRLAKRYLVQGIPFAGSLLAGAAVRRIRRAPARPE
ncbi:MAG: WecB/TagA/CpsF family glycosyltransferase, partial [Phycisphaerae bacterium]